MARLLRAGLRLASQVLRAKVFYRSVALILVLGLGATIAFTHLPVVVPQGQYSRALFDRNGRLLIAEVSPHDEQWRFAPVEQLPNKYVTALLTFEDKRFYMHRGVDLLSIGRALWSNITAGKVVSGASTLTMQVVRLARRNSHRSLFEKIWEALLALRLERSLSKKDILDVYASHAPFGGNVVGLRAAAWRYFQRPAQELTWAEATTLAVLPNSPSLIHLGRSRDALRAKRDRLLKRLHALGHLSDTDARSALDEPLLERPSSLPTQALHFMHSYVPKGQSYHSSLDRELQQRVRSRLNNGLKGLKNIGVHNASALVIHVETGEVRAYVGNASPLSAHMHSPHVDINRAPRSTGSLLKPFLYGMMLDTGELLPKQLVTDLPVRIGGFRPLNFDRKFRGVVPADKALAMSLNVPAALLLRQFGLPQFKSELNDAGLQHLVHPPSHYGLSLILGGAEATPVEMAELYAQLSFAAQFENRDWPGLKLGPNQQDAPKLNISPGGAYLTIKALYEVRRPAQQAAWRTFGSGQYIAWKTGTSFGYRDGWAIGITPEYTVAVWTGNADGEGRPGLTGVQAAAPLLFALFDLLPTGTEFLPPERHLKRVETCAWSGYLATPNCSRRVSQSVPASAPAGSPCPYCRTVPLSLDGRYRVHAGCVRLAEIMPQPRFVLPPRQEHYYKSHNPSYRGLPPFRPGCEPSIAQEQNLAVLFPRNQADIYLPIQLDGERSKVIFKATHRRTKAQLFWHLDDTYLGVTEQFHEFEVSAPPGPHVLTIVDEWGESARRNFKVMDRPKLIGGGDHN